MIGAADFLQDDITYPILTVDSLRTDSVQLAHSHRFLKA